MYVARKLFQPVGDKLGAVEVDEKATVLPTFPLD